MVPLVKPLSDQPAKINKPSSHATLEGCSGCRAPITLPALALDRPVGVWLCAQCGAVYFGDDDTGATQPSCGLVRAPEELLPLRTPRIQTNVAANSGPPEHIQRLVRSIAGVAYRGPERRRAKHYRVTQPVVAVPLGQDFRVMGEPVEMTTLNVSLYGAALAHTRFTNIPHYALDFAMGGAELIQVVMEVSRVRSLGIAYEIAGPFISGLTQKL